MRCRVTRRSFLRSAAVSLPFFAGGCAGLDGLCRRGANDKVNVAIFATGEDLEEIGASLSGYKEYLASQTLALSVSLDESSQAPLEATEVEWGDNPVKIFVSKI